MAHFFDATTAAPLVTCPIQVGQKKTVGLWGGDFFGNDLGVFIDQDLVRMKETNRQNGMRYFDLTGVKAGETSLHAYAGLYDYALPIDVKVTKKMGTPQGKLVQRQGIVDEARSHVGKAHYLWGAAGNTPDLNDGARYKPLVAKMQPDSLLAVSPSVRTAYTVLNGSTKKNTCAGSCNKYSQPEAAEVSKFLQTGSAIVQNNLTPRTYMMNDQIKPIGKTNNGIVWGEACVGRKHFDCIGFVSYCVDKFWKGTIAFGADIKLLMGNPSFLNCVEIKDATDVLNGDIIGQYDDAKGGWHHIGLVYIVGKAPIVVQAADSPIGVIDGTAYNKDSWTKRIRLMDNML